jgi:hypothetical protein
VPTNNELVTAVIATGNGRIANATPFIGANTENYTEPRYILTSTAVGVDLVVNVSIPMSQLTNTIFGLNTTMYFDEVILMDVQWNSVVNMAMETNGVPALVAYNTAANAGVVSLSNLHFRMAVEVSPIVASELKSKVLNGEGLKLMIPYLWNYKNLLSVNGAGDNTYTAFRINRGMLSKLCTITSAFFPNTSTGPLSYFIE